MSPELTNKLFNKYPLIFADKDKPPSKSLICFGLEFDDGWANLVDNLCSFIQGYIDVNKDIPQVVAIQCKEKWGQLRFYYDGGDEIIAGAASFAEHLSGTVCEVCGSNVNVGRTTKGYIRTLCINCKDKGGQEWIENEKY